MGCPERVEIVALLLFGRHSQSAAEEGLGRFPSPAGNSGTNYGA